MVGGMIATNAGGINALRYGTVRQMVLGLEACSRTDRFVGNLRRAAQGQRRLRLEAVASSAPREPSASSTAAVLRLTPLPRERCVSFSAVASPAHAVRLLERMQDEVRRFPHRFRLMSGSSIERAVRFVGGRLPVAPAAW
jgi:FAD/FMN-containing dehydrogenase